ncbi:MAG: TIGR02266 family protein [Polyangiaceae bacterium]|nr:TIGR02266 family protein [Polyangiaceae bacterium]
MSQDPRKDKRAKIVSVNVRYKSATVDEFIDNHSNDVSKGGIFVKTPAPFPPGTLLKFEIRLAGDKSILGGIGRVAWKRDSAQATVDKPAGMGVKFIKIDDASRAVIDRLVATKADAGRAYTSEFAAADRPTGENVQSTLLGISAVPEARPPLNKPTPITVPAMPAVPKPAAPPTTPLPKHGPMAGAIARPVRPPSTAIPPLTPTTTPLKKATMIGVAPQSFERPPARAPQGAAPTTPTEKAPEPEPKVEGPRPLEAATGRKPTMVGMGNFPPPTEAKTHEAKPVEAASVSKAKSAEPMFPEATPAGASETAPEPTVMKQAAELLEEALKEAGGSLDEIDQNPLFSKADKDITDKDITEKVSEVPAVTATPVDQPVPSAPSPPVETPLPSAEVPLPVAETPSPPAEAEEAEENVSTAPAEPISSPPPAKLADQVQAPTKKKSGAWVVIALLLALIAAGVAYALGVFSTGEGAGDASTSPSTPATEVPPLVPNAAEGGIEDSGAPPAAPVEMDAAAEPERPADTGYLSTDATTTQAAPEHAPRAHTHHGTPRSPDGSVDAATPPGQQDAAPKPGTPPVEGAPRPRPIEVPAPADASAPTE